MGNIIVPLEDFERANGQTILIHKSIPGIPLEGEETEIGYNARNNQDQSFGQYLAVRLNEMSKNPGSWSSIVLERFKTNALFSIISALETLITLNDNITTNVNAGFQSINSSLNGMQKAQSSMIDGINDTVNKNIVQLGSEIDSLKKRNNESKIY